jgi:hypothetical protein
MDLQLLRDPDADLPRAWLRVIRPAGYLITRLQQAWRQGIYPALAQLDLPMELRQTLAGSGQGESLEPLTLSFYQTSTETWQLHPLCALAVMGLDGLTCWHLPALRTRWQQQLRRTHSRHLMALLPKSWFVQSQPLPPLGVVPHLGLTHWSEFSEKRPPNTSYCLIQGQTQVMLEADQPSAMWQEKIQAVLTAGAAVLVEWPASGPSLRAVYQQDQGKVVLTSLSRSLAK